MAELAELYDCSVLSGEEFERQKQLLLNPATAVTGHALQRQLLGDRWNRGHAGDSSGPA